MRVARIPVAVWLLPSGFHVLFGVIGAKEFADCLKSTPPQRADGRRLGERVVDCNGAEFYFARFDGAGRFQRLREHQRIGYHVSLNGRASTSKLQALRSCRTSWNTVSATPSGLMKKLSGLSGMRARVRSRSTTPSTTISAT